MEIKPIKTERDYHAALKEVEKLFGAKPGTPAGDQLEILSTLIESYEDAHYDIPAPDPIEAINYFMESRGLTRTDIERYIGSRARVSEILNRKRPLTLPMIQRLHTGLGIPADILVKPYKIGSSRRPIPRTPIAA
jgi:HTH-type transcriptional regulator/antitoxin HigA